MRKSDKQLGMDRRITRRDTIIGASTVALAGLNPVNPGMAYGDGKALGNATTTPYYPPGLTGLRGNHVGSFEVAHRLGRQRNRDWGPVKKLNSVNYDLVVVGAGLSGLSAAFFYRQKDPDARILILDNHDDFGGHAKRNEFTVNGKQIISYGGSQTLSQPSRYSSIVKQLLRDLAVDLDEFEKAYDSDFWRRNDLSSGVFFDEDRWGESKIVPFNMGYYEGYLPIADAKLNTKEAIAQMPVSEAAKVELLNIYTERKDLLADLSLDEKWTLLYSISYRDFLARYFGVKEKDTFDFFQDLTGDAGAGTDAITAATAFNYTGLPGPEAAGLPDYPTTEPYIHHFPDGNASIARLLVAKMVPGIAEASDMKSLLTSDFDYDKLDQPNADIQIRLNSTVVNVRRMQSSQPGDSVAVTYVQDGETIQIDAKNCVLACNHSIIPHLCPDLPKPQLAALSFQERAPILYTNVALKNWRAWKKKGIGAILAPGSYYVHAKIDFPVSLGDYEFSSDPDEPVIIHMERFPRTYNQNLSVRDQNQIGRYELIATSFEDIERKTRQQLDRMFGDAGFDVQNDIAASTVNRWAHGYSYSYQDLFGEIHDDWDDERHPHVIARKPFGPITIANSDAAANAMLEAAVEEAHRAVIELVER